VDLVGSLVGSSGRVRRRTLGEDEVAEIRDQLVVAVDSLIRGHTERIYLPLTTDIRGFAGLKTLLRDGGDPGRVVENFRELIGDLVRPRWVKLPSYSKVVEDAIARCAEVAGYRLGESWRGLAFVNKYLYVDNAFIRDAVVTLIQGVRYRGGKDIMETMIVDEGYTLAYEECRRIKVGGGRGDVLEGRFSALAHIYDNIFVLTGVATHQPCSPGELTGRSKSRTLFVTPFARGFYFVLGHPESQRALDDYVEAYTGFVARVVEGFARGERFETVAVSVSRYLNEFKGRISINTSPDDNALRRSVLVLWRLLEGLR
jgi:hypothetical protein